MRIQGLTGCEASATSFSATDQRGIAALPGEMGHAQLLHRSKLISASMVRPLRCPHLIEAALLPVLRGQEDHPASDGFRKPTRSDRIDIQLRAILSIDQPLTKAAKSRECSAAAGRLPQTEQDGATSTGGGLANLAPGCVRLLKSSSLRCVTCERIATPGNGLRNAGATNDMPRFETRVTTHLRPTNGYVIENRLNFGDYRPA